MGSTPLQAFKTIQPNPRPILAGEYPALSLLSDTFSGQEVMKSLYYQLSASIKSQI